MGILGASYGGYMVLAALAFHPDAFDVGVDVFGISDWVSALKEIPPSWEAGRQALYHEMGNPETQEEMLRSQKNEVPVEYLVLPDAGHGFGSKKNEAEASTRIRTFLDRYLRR